MTTVSFKNLVISLLFLTSISLVSCHDKAKKNETSTANADTTTTNTTTTPVEIAPDDSLKNGVRDATKDYPQVNATVSDGEITLTGNITREKLPKLMMALNSLHPKKINNNLVIK